MRAASAMARKIGFREININAGCPSEKVSGTTQ
jgi:tRNA-dihydrouridine synthase